MRLILDFTDRNPDGRITIISRQRILGAIAAGLAAAAIAVYITANLVAAYWIKSGADIAADIARQAVQAENEDRRRLWRESLGILEEDIAALNARVLGLYSKGAALSRRLGLPGDEMFAIRDDTGDELEAHSLLCDAKTSHLQLEERQIKINTNLIEQTEKLSTLESKYGALSEQGIRNTVLQKTIPLDRPLIGRHWVSSRYGYRRDPFTGRRAFHAGDDYAAKRGTPVIAAADGMVIYAGRLGNYGNAVHLYHGDNISTLYGHLHKIHISSWQYVKQGEIIGTVGSTGRSTGPHLHYEVRIDNQPKSVVRTIKKLHQQRNLQL